MRSGLFSPEVLAVGRSHQTHLHRFNEVRAIQPGSTSGARASASQATSFNEVRAIQPGSTVISSTAPSR